MSFLNCLILAYLTTCLFTTLFRNMYSHRFMHTYTTQKNWAHAYTHTFPWILHNKLLCFLFIYRHSKLETSVSPLYSAWYFANTKHPETTFRTKVIKHWWPGQSLTTSLRLLTSSIICTHCDTLVTSLAQ